MKPEIERKFIVETKKLPVELKKLPMKEIQQGYLVWNDKGDEVRIRQIGDEYRLTIKRGQGLKRLETDIGLSEDQFLKLWHLTEGKRLEKTRYYYHSGKFVVEIDVYKGLLKGIVIAEVEFETESDYKNFNSPDWFGREVSEEEAFKNLNLALSGKKPVL